MYGESSSNSLRMAAEGGGSAVEISFCFARGNEAFVELRTMELHGLFGNSSLMLEAVFSA